MWAFVLKRLCSGLLTLWVVVSLTFFLLRLLPGGPFNNPKSPPAVVAQLEARYGLSDPLWQQYGRYMGQLLQGDLGPSLVNESREVAPMVQEAFGVSLLVGVPALVLGLVLGVLAALWAALKAHAPIDTLLSTLGLMALSIPSFVLSGVLVLVFALGLQWLPAATLFNPWGVVLPTVSLALVPFAFSFLLLRTLLLETLQQPYLKAKLAAGLKHRRIVIHHLLRNACLPLLAVLGPIAASLVTGSFAVETIFALPGLGKQFIYAVNNRDYTLVMGVTILYSTLLIGLNLLAEWLSLVLDPRLKEA